MLYSEAVVIAVVAIVILAAVEGNFKLFLDLRIQVGCTFNNSFK